MIPHLEAGEIILSPFTLEDSPLVELYAGSSQVARTTLNIPHPYPKGAAAEWIASHLPQFLDQSNVVFAIRCPGEGLVGAINLKLDLNDKRAELGYWVAVPYWGKGYGTAATRAVIRYGFDHFSLNKIYARHLSGNTGSGRIMQKAGMTQEGIQRQHTIKDGVVRDIIEYGILRSEFFSVY